MEKRYKLKKSNGDYADLVSLFEEFREFIKPAVVDGVPDFKLMSSEEENLRRKKDLVSGG